MPAEDRDTHRGDRACPGSEELGICSGLQISPLQVPRLPHLQGQLWGQQAPPELRGCDRGPRWQSGLGCGGLLGL